MPTVPPTTPQSHTPTTPGETAARKRFVLSAAVLTFAFALPLWELLRFSLQSRLYSHILLIPVVSLYFLWQKKSSLPPTGAPHRPLAALFFLSGLVLAGFWIWLRSSGAELAPIDRLALSTSAWLLCLAGLCAWFLGRPLLRAVAFPLAFLVFMVPLPTAVENATETFLQHGSALAAHGLFLLAGSTVFAEDLSFQLPGGITIQVAPECSGIHSSLALLITSIVTGRLLLRTNSRRTILALSVVPLALLRNGFRVFVIGELCVRQGPHMIDSYIHHHGGPIFFSLSLVPFFLLLAWLFRSERKKLPKPSAPHQ